MPHPHTWGTDLIRRATVSRLRRPSLGLGPDIDHLVFANVLWGAGTGFYVYLLPLYVADLGADPAQIGFVLALTSVVQAMVYIPAGVLADRLGRRPLMLFGWALGPAAMLLFFGARTWQHLIPAFVLLAAVAWSAPAYHSYVATAAGPRQAPYAFMMMFVGVTVGTTLTAPVGGWLAEQFGLRTLFGAAFAGYLLSTLVVATLSPHPVQQTGRPHERRDDPAGAPPPAPVTPMTTATPPAVRRPLRRWWARRGGVRGLWEDRFVLSLALTAILTFAANLAQPLSPNWLTERYGFLSVDIGLFGGLSALGGAALAIWLGRLQRRRGTQHALPLAIGGLAVYAALLLFAGTWPLAALAYTLRGIFGIVPSLAVALVATVLSASGGATASAGSERRLGLGFALYNTATAIAVTLSTGAAGWLYGTSPALPFVASAVLLTPLTWVAWAAAVRITTEPRISTVGR